MKCENKFCIYNNKDLCIVTDHVKIDSKGFCDTCIYIDIPDKTLEKFKDTILRWWDDDR